MYYSEVKDLTANLKEIINEADINYTCIPRTVIKNLN